MMLRAYEGSSLRVGLFRVNVGGMSFSARRKIFGWKLLARAIRTLVENRDGTETDGIATNTLLVSNVQEVGCRKNSRGKSTPNQSGKRNNDGGNDGKA